MKLAGWGGLRKNGFCRGSMDNIYELLSYNIKKTRVIKINNIINRISAVFELHYFCYYSHHCHSTYSKKVTKHFVVPSPRGIPCGSFGARCGSSSHGTRMFQI